MVLKVPGKGAEAHPRIANGHLVRRLEETSSMEMQVEMDVSKQDIQRRHQLMMKTKKWWKETIWKELLLQERQGKLRKLQDYQGFIKLRLVKDEYEKLLGKMKDELPEVVPPGGPTIMIAREDLKVYLAEEVYKHFTAS